MSRRSPLARVLAAPLLPGVVRRSPAPGAPRALPLVPASPAGKRRSRALIQRGALGGRQPVGDPRLEEPPTIEVVVPSLSGVRPPPPAAWVPAVEPASHRPGAEGAAPGRPASSSPAARPPSRDAGEKPARTGERSPASPRPDTAGARDIGPGPRDDRGRERAQPRGAAHPAPPVPAPHAPSPPGRAVLPTQSADGTSEPGFAADVLRAAARRGRGAPATPTTAETVARKARTSPASTPPGATDGRSPEGGAAKRAMPPRPVASAPAPPATPGRAAPSTHAVPPRPVPPGSRPPVPAPSPQRRPPTPAPAPTPAAPSPAPISIEIGRVEIRTAPTRAAAPPVRRVTPAREHVIDPGLPAAGRRRR